MKHAQPPLVKPFQCFVLALAFALTPAFADEYSDVGQLMRAGKLGDAMVKADLYLASNPRDPQMRFLKGVLQRDSGKQADAITTFTKLTEDYPELPEPYNNLAVLYAGQSQFDKARAALEMAIRTNPSYATAHENLGDVYAKLASQAYNKALQLDGTNTAVPPKLALIRELFNPGAKGQRVSGTPTAAALVAITSAAPAKAALAPAAPSTPAAPTGTPPGAPVSPAASVAAVPAMVKTPATTAAQATAPASATAPALATARTPAMSAAADSAAKEAESAIRAWAAAWSAKDMAGYLAAYGKDFGPPAGLSRSAWEEERRIRITGKSSINVRVENLTVSINGSKAVAKFRQDYRAAGLSVSSRKTLDLVKTGNRWLIAREFTGA